MINVNRTIIDKDHTSDCRKNKPSAVYIKRYERKEPRVIVLISRLAK